MIKPAQFNWDTSGGGGNGWFRVSQMLNSIPKTVGSLQVTRMPNATPSYTVERWRLQTGTVGALFNGDFSEVKHDANKITLSETVSMMGAMPSSGKVLVVVYNIGTTTANAPELPATPTPTATAPPTAK